MTFQFRAPAQAGQYPYVCTFPAHWRIMNGMLNVVAPQGRGTRRGLASRRAPGVKVEGTRASENLISPH